MEGVVFLPKFEPIFALFMKVSKSIIVFIVFFWTVTFSYGQDYLTLPTIPAMRQLHHEYIIKSLAQIDSLKLQNSKLSKSEIDGVRIQVTRMRIDIETNDRLDNNGKYKWLRGVNEILSGFIKAYHAKSMTAVQYPELVNAYDLSLHLEWSGVSIEPIIKSNNIEIAQLIIDNYGLKENIGMSKSKDVLLLKLCDKYPSRILSLLSQNPNNRYADSLIVVAGFKNPEDLYTYAAAPNALGKKIQSVNHPFIKLVAQLSLTRTGRMYFPFLDNIYKRILPIDSITPYVRNDTSIGYFKLLVKTRIQYAERMAWGDTPMVANVLTAKLKSKAVELFINDINALHDENNETIRFKKIEGLSPEELYYLAVLGEDEMYTSSFVSGVYPRIFSRMKIARSDQLLANLKNDYYKKFLKIAASYNKLDDFLSRMDKIDAEILMRNFVSGLDKTGSLEDAVDVADSYAVIYNNNLRKLILKQVQSELIRCNDIHEMRGVAIYELLNNLFLSLETGNKNDLSAKLGIKPIYELAAKDLIDSLNGKIIMQQFFYGDKDGVVVFNAFLNKFRNPQWRIVNKPNWVEVSSVKGLPITIYSNLPLDETLELDEHSQDSLITYLENNNLTPTIAIHRGHSYYLNHTIKNIPASAKLILLGSCGGYQKMNDVLANCPEAHIIASKQVGTGIINQGLIDVISDYLRRGKNLNWPELWNNLAIRFSGTAKEKFDDYVPPYKNLGAIFISAYQKRLLGF